MDYISLTVLVLLFLAFCGLAYQLRQGGQSNASLIRSNSALQSKCDDLSTKLDRASEEKRQLMAELNKTQVALRSCQSAIENQ